MAPHLGTRDATDHPDDEPVPEAPAHQKHTMTCHLTQVNWNESHFQTFKCSILEFSTDFVTFNANRGLSVTHKSVVGYWYQLIWSVFGEGNSTCNSLESQVDSPRFNTFCIEHKLLDDTRNHEEDKGFRLSGRKATRGENRRWPGVLVMEASDGREVLVPLVGLSALKDVHYKALVRSILETNPAFCISFAEMQLLWDAIVYKVYHFVCACEREAKGIESMAVNGYTERQYERLVREVNDDEKPTSRSKRLHDESSYEDKSEDSEESPIEQAKKRK